MNFNLNLLEAFAELDKLYEENEQSDQFAAGFNEARELLSKNGGIPYDILIDTYDEYLNSTNNKDWYAGFFFVVARILAAIPVLNNNENNNNSSTTSFLRDLRRLDLELVFMLNAHIVEQALVSKDIGLTYIDDTHNTLHPGPGSNTPDLQNDAGVTFDVKNTNRPDIIRVIENAEKVVKNDIKNKDSTIEIENFWIGKTHNATHIFIAIEKSTEVTIYKAKIKENDRKKLTLLAIPISGLNIPPVFDRNKAEKTEGLASIIKENLRRRAIKLKSDTDNGYNDQIDKIFSSILDPKYFDVDNIFHETSDEINFARSFNFENDNAMDSLNEAINTCITALERIVREGTNRRVTNLKNIEEENLGVKVSSADKTDIINDVSNNLVALKRELANTNNVDKIIEVLEAKLLNSKLINDDALVNKVKNTIKEIIDNNKYTTKTRIKDTVKDDVNNIKNDIKNNLYVNFLTCWKEYLIAFNKLLNDDVMKQVLSNDSIQKGSSVPRILQVATELCNLTLFNNSNYVNTINNLSNHIPTPNINNAKNYNYKYIITRLIKIIDSMYKAYIECVIRVLK